MKTHAKIQHHAKTQLALPLAVAAYGLFFFLSLGIVSSLTRTIDTTILISLQGVIPTSLDRYLSLLSVLGSFEVTVVFLILLTIRNKRLLFWAFTCFVIAHGIEVFGKLFFFHPSVPPLYHRYDFPFTMVSSGFQTGNSYPSGHSMRSVFLLLLSFWYIPKKVKILFFAGIAFMALILVSRVSLGEHWPSDVVGGSLLGLGSYFLVKYLKDYY